MGNPFESYRSLDYPLPATTLGWNLYGVGLESMGKDGKPEAFPMPEPGDDQLLVRIDSVIATTWAAITPEHTAVDGTPVRDLATWIPLHTTYWNGLLAPFGLAITDDMPVWIEPFTPLFSTWPPA